jgi:acyl-CoA synthetase (AMP-forming)/AMP-acid ligase II
MLYAALSAASYQHAQDPVLVLDDVPATYGQLAAQTAPLCERFRGWKGKRVGVALPLSPALVATLAALDHAGATAFLLEPQADKSLRERFALDEFLDLPATTPTDVIAVTSPAIGGKLVITTSGTTGAPKGVVHSWENLGRKLKVRDELRGGRWLLTYRFTLFAGIQVFLQALVNTGCLVAVSDSSMRAIFDAMRRHRVNFVSATPTFWKKLLLSVDRSELAQLALTQITLGAEIVTEQLLDQLRAALPGVRLAQIFATTETGVCFTVSDGHAGFPESYLQSPPPGVRLKIEDGELFIQSEARMERYANGSAAPADWIATGDLVEVRDGRVQFLGRKSDLINVGGSKVSPIEVEQVISAVPGVAHARVLGRANPVTGSIVVAEVVPAAGLDRAELEKQIHAACAQRLPAFKRPRIITFVDAISTGPSGKIQRRVEVSA